MNEIENGIINIMLYFFTPFPFEERVSLSDIRSERHLIFYLFVKNEQEMRNAGYLVFMDDLGNEQSN